MRARLSPGHKTVPFVQEGTALSAGRSQKGPDWASVLLTVAHDTATVHCAPAPVGLYTSAKRAGGRDQR